MITFLYIAVIVLACVGIVLFFVLYNKKNEKIKQKLKDAGEFDKTIVKAEPDIIEANFDGLNKNLSEQQLETDVQTEKVDEQQPIVEKENLAKKATQKAEDVGVFEDFSLEDETQQKQKENVSDEQTNPFFKKKFFFDDDAEENHDEFANDSFDDFDGFEKYKQMLREERQKIDDEYNFDDDFFQNSRKDTSQMNDELKKILLDENKRDEEDE